MKDDLRGAKIFLLMMAALILCFVLSPWMQYIIMPMMEFPLKYIMMGWAWIFQPKGDAGLGIVFFIFMICYYLEMLGTVSIIYWLIKWLIRRGRARQHPEPNVMPGNSKEQRDGDSREN